MGNVLGSSTVQPVSGENEWDAPLSQCCTGAPGLMCVEAYCCTGSAVGQISEQYGEGFGLSAVPLSHMMLRTEVRERYNIKGSICRDWLAGCCLGPCTVLQLAKEVNKRHPY